MIRTERSAPMTLTWIPSHTEGTDQHSLGNAAADKLANQARERCADNRSNEALYAEAEERVIPWIQPSKTRNESKNNPQAEQRTHIIGDVRAELKREITRQLTSEVAQRGSPEGQGKLFLTNPSSALLLAKRIRASRESQKLACLLELMTQTGDTAERRAQVQKSDQAKEAELKTACRLCKSKPETLVHILLECTTNQQPAANNNMQKQIQTCLDPLEKSLPAPAWAARTTMSQSSILLDNWCKSFSLSDQEKNLVREIQDHEQLAGAIGILPQRIDEYLLLYFKKWSPHLFEHESVLKWLHKLIDELLEQLQMNSFNLSFQRWKQWRSRIKRLKSSKQQKETKPSKIAKTRKPNQQPSAIRVDRQVRRPLGSSRKRNFGSNRFKGFHKTLLLPIPADMPKLRPPDPYESPSTPQSQACINFYKTTNPDPWRNPLTTPSPTPAISPSTPSPSPTPLIP
jgi:hypothetical protein